jgi:hypothetical protein
MAKINRRNHYRILHVQPDAPTEVIKASYRALMLKLGAHPDRGGDVWSAAVINEAYRVLANPALRRDYDRHLRNERAEFDPIRRRTPLSPSTHKPNPASGRYRTASRRCLFCGTENAAGIPGCGEEARCRRCGSPLARVATRLRGASERRAANRVALRDEIPFYADWPQSAPLQGRVVDLSPLGMQFVADRILQPGQMIKLDGRGLSAVARVVRCSRRATQRGDHLVGVQFVTLAVKGRTAAT